MLWDWEGSVTFDSPQLCVHQSTHHSLEIATFFVGSFKKGPPSFPQSRIHLYVTLYILQALHVNAHKAVRKHSKDFISSGTLFFFYSLLADGSACLDSWHHWCHYNLVILILWNHKTNMCSGSQHNPCYEMFIIKKLVIHGKFQNFI